MNLIKTTLAVALASVCASTQAAHFIFPTGNLSLIGGYTYAEATTEAFGTVSADGLVDILSGAPTLLGFGALSEQATDGSALITYDWVREVTLDAQTDPSSVGFSIGGTSVIGFDGIAGLQGVVETSKVELQTTLMIMPDGETLGSAIRARLSGSADSIFSTSLPGLEQSTTFNLIASSGGQSVSYTGNGAMDAFDLSLDTVVGAEVTLSLSYITRPGWVGAAIDIPAGTVQGFEESGLMAGTLTLAPVPEPEQYALLLAGLGLIGAAARRRRG